VHLNSNHLKTLKVFIHFFHNEERPTKARCSVPDPLDEMTLENSISYMLRTVLADGNSATFKKYVCVLCGSETVRTMLCWAQDTNQVLVGLNITAVCHLIVYFTSIPSGKRLLLRVFSTLIVVPVWIRVLHYRWTCSVQHVHEHDSGHGHGTVPTVRR
jgi:hypothetical protein